MASRLRTAWNTHRIGVDVATAIVATAAGIGSLFVEMRVLELSGDPAAIPRWSAITWTVALCLPLAVRRTQPLLSAGIIGLVFAGYRQWEVPEYTVSAIVIFVAIVSAGLYGQRGRDLVRGAIVGALMTVLVITLLASEVPVELRPVFRWGVVFSIVYNVVFVGAAWLLGDVLRRQGERQRALEETARQLLVEREANAQRAVTEERLRIAREVHDVVAHHVSLMGVQAGAARRIGGRDPDRVTELLSTVEDSSREAVDELRRLVGLLRAGYARAADGERSLEPLPGLGRLDRLVADTRATGLDVSLTVVGDERAVPDSVSVSAYRVVQEAVTNTIKHAHARRCAVGVEYSADAVEVSVVDDGIGTRAPAVVGSDGSNPAPNGGHGVVGMDERVALHGGRLDIGPRPEGGFGVRARFPVRNAP